MMIGHPEDMDTASMGDAALTLGVQIKQDLLTGKLQIATLVGDRLVTHAGISKALFGSLLSQAASWRRAMDPNFKEVSPADLVEFLNLGGREFAKGNTWHPAVPFVKCAVGLNWYAESESALFPNKEPQITAHNTLSEISFIDKAGWVIGTDVGIGMPQGRPAYLLVSPDASILYSVVLKTLTRTTKTLVATPRESKPFTFVKILPPALFLLAIAGIAILANGSSITLPPQYLLPFALAVCSTVLASMVSYSVLKQQRKLNAKRSIWRWSLVALLWAAVILGLGAVFKFVASHSELNLSDVISNGVSSFAAVVPRIVSRRKGRLSAEFSESNPAEIAKTIEVEAYAALDASFKDARAYAWDEGLAFIKDPSTPVDTKILLAHAVKPADLRQLGHLSFEVSLLRRRDTGQWFAVKGAERENDPEHIGRLYLFDIWVHNHPGPYIFPSHMDLNFYKSRSIGLATRAFIVHHSELMEFDATRVRLPNEDVFYKKRMRYERAIQNPLERKIFENYLTRINVKLNEYAWTQLPEDLFKTGAFSLSAAVQPSNAIHIRKVAFLELSSLGRFQENAHLFWDLYRAFAKDRSSHVQIFALMGLYGIGNNSINKNEPFNDAEKLKLLQSLQLFAQSPFKTVRELAETHLDSFMQYWEIADLPAFSARQRSATAA